MHDFILGKYAFPVSMLHYSQVLYKGKTKGQFRKGKLVARHNKNSNEGLKCCNGYKSNPLIRGLIQISTI